MTSEHWDSMYRDKGRANVSWFEERPQQSLELITQFAPTTASVIDVGGGASDLASELLAANVTDVTVLDLSSEAVAYYAHLEVATAVGDVRTWQPPRTYDVWHDRAVGHFMTSLDDQLGYLSTLRAAVAPSGIAIIEGFAPDGPESCSGLAVRRGFPTLASQLLSDEFECRASGGFIHVTPWGAEQAFEWVVLARA
jgi:trans-aconitate methyltransferase